MSATYEEMLAFIAAQLPEPVEQDGAVEDGVVFTGGDPGEVIVRLTPATVAVAEYAVRWHGPDDPVVDPIGIGAVNWTRGSADSVIRVLKALIAMARESRIAKYRVCTRCERTQAPEWMFDDEVCRACASRETPEQVH